VSSRRLNFDAFSCAFFVWIFAGACLSIDLELPVQKTQGFLVLIALTPRSLVHAHQVFGEMCVRP
jgi:hypothetical protein